MIEVQNPQDLNLETPALILINAMPGGNPIRIFHDHLGASEAITVPSPFNAQGKPQVAALPLEHVVRYLPELLIWMHKGYVLVRYREGKEAIQLSPEEVSSLFKQRAQDQEQQRQAQAQATQQQRAGGVPADTSQQWRQAPTQPSSADVSQQPPQFPPPLASGYSGQTKSTQTKK